ncbi:MAG: hypothetical protein ABR508_07160 [Candidatus Baltobacteraceae bacterium]
MSRGFTLAETAIGAAVVAVAALAMLFALAQAAHFSAHSAGPVRTAAEALAGSLLRDAQASWKYGSPGAVPAGAFATSLPLANAPAAPVSVTLTVSNASATDAQIAVRVQYTPDPGRGGDRGIVLVQGSLFVKAPLPGTQVARPGLVPMPSSAP